MNDTNQRLIKCFQTVFPDLSEAQIPLAQQSNTKDWDSVAAITLVNVIEEEFGIELDLDKLADLDSFDKVSAYLKAEHAIA
jgi:acyl carrier protein